MKDILKIGDTVYIPSEDPKADTIYTIEALSRDHARLYHPDDGVRYLEQGIMKPAKVLPLAMIEKSPF